jgi:ABC-type phosphate/phosphonate transport system substrate-binding protein
MKSLFAVLSATMLFLAFPATFAAGEDRPVVLQLVVMDPLSAPLSCDCVKGYAQRKYEKLGEYLSDRLKRKVDVTWTESLEKTLAETKGKADLVIGKDSVVRYDARKAKFPVTPIAAMTDKNGKTTQTGLIVVRKDDPAKSVGDLSGYRILFGPQDCAEKYAAPRELLKKHGVPLPAKVEIEATCSTAAKALMEIDADVKAAAVISSYAEPLLAGCGTIKKGDLRVIGVSDEVPFITAFAADSLDPSLRDALRTALLDVGEQADLLTALETSEGFVQYKPAAEPKKQAATAPASGSKTSAGGSSSGTSASSGAGSSSGASASGGNGGSSTAVPAPTKKK